MAPNVSRGHESAEERDIRVEDYLNDKLQTSADLESLDILLDSIKNQQGLLKTQARLNTLPNALSALLTKGQLREAEIRHAETTKASNEHSSILLQEVKRFKKQQAGIDRRLLILTQSDTSDDAIRKFDSSMESLQRLDVAKGYFELLTEVENLRYY